MSNDVAGELYSKLVMFKESSEDIIKYIQEHNIDINIRFKNPNYYNILTGCFTSSAFSSDSDRFDLIKYVVENGININEFIIIGGLKRNVLWNACFVGHEKAITYLVQQGIELTDGLLSAEAYTTRFAKLIKAHPNILDYVGMIVHYKAYKLLPDEVRDLFIF